MVNKEEAELPRLPVPNTTALQASIISSVEGMPQHRQFLTQDAKPSNRWSRSFRFALPLALCGIVFFAAVISPSHWIGGGTGSVSELSQPLLSDESLDWQQIMRTEDEWLLADL
ncbi:MAG: hypothetical protein ACI854_001631 [Arenicella sp.]|jgi:hypothetical protein